MKKGDSTVKTIEDIARKQAAKRDMFTRMIPLQTSKKVRDLSLTRFGFGSQ
jgi:hypothetical protein